jgi:hypothetical protein
MHERHPLVLRLAIGVALLAVVCAAAGVAVVALRQPPPRTHVEQVAYELGRRGVRHGPVVLGEMWPDRTNLQYGSYVGPISMSVAVTLSDGGKSVGWIECRTLGRECTLTLRALGVQDAALPDLAAGREPAWRSWLDAAAERVRWW